MSGMKTHEKIELAGMLVGLAVLIFSVFSYFAAAADDRALKAEENALDYGRTFSKELQRQLGELRVSMTHYSRYGDLNSADVISDEVFAHLAQEVLFGKNPAGGPAGVPYVYLFEKMDDFFVNAQACYDSAVCDKAILQQLLCAPLERFYVANRRMIDFYSVNYSGGDFGHGITGFVDICRPFVAGQ